MGQPVAKVKKSPAKLRNNCSLLGFIIKIVCGILTEKPLSHDVPCAEGRRCNAAAGKI